MSCICNSPVRPEFKDSYKDLLDKPKINGVTLSGDLTAADLGIKAGAQFKIVQQLPVTDIEETTVYLVPAQVGQTDNIYQEWIYINNKWEKVGEPINIQIEEPTVKTARMHLFLTDDSEDFIVIDSISKLASLTGITLKSDSIYLYRYTFGHYSVDITVKAPLFDIINSSSRTKAISFPSGDSVSPDELIMNSGDHKALVGDISTFSGVILLSGKFLGV